MKLAQESDDVFVALGPIATIGQEEVAFLKSAAAASARGRVRINAHPDPGDGLHEMFIAIRRDSYIRPHKHPGKSEAFHLIHGAVDIVIFDDHGEIDDLIPLSADASDGGFYYRQSEPRFHTLHIKTDLLVVHEITNGPFRPAETVYAGFAPDEMDLAAVAAFRNSLAERIAAAGIPR